MTNPTNKEIRERHESKPFRIVTSWADEWAIAHQDRGILLDRLEAAEQRIKELEELTDTQETNYRKLEAENAEVNADLAAERRVNHTLQESLNTAEAKLKAIGELPVIDGNKLVEIFHGDYVSPDDFVSASELKALLEDK